MSSKVNELQSKLVELYEERDRAQKDLNYAREAIRVREESLKPLTNQEDTNKAVDE